MLTDRLAVAVPLIPLAVWIIWLGGPVYALTVAAILMVAGQEFVRIFRAGGHRPALLLVMAGAPVVALVRLFRPGDLSLVFAALVVAALVWHLADFENGAQASGTDFVITLGGIFYLGWMGSYLTALRELPDGLWWTAVLLGAIWLADSAAYVVGRALGRNLLAPRLSPKKTWEGFFGGIAGGAVGSAVLALLWRLGAGPASLVDWHTAALLGALTGLVGPLGDLGISMLKRESGLKDSGAVITGHGGALDRIDSWLVSIPVGYYVVLLLQSLVLK